MQRFPSKPLPEVEGKSSLWQRYHRYESVMATIREFLQQYAGKTPAVLLEGYAFDSKNKREVLAEFGSMLRQYLLATFDDALVAEVAPSTMKKFVTGTGNSAKLGVVVHLVKQTNQDLATDDEYDALGMARLALAVADPSRATKKHERGAVDTVTNPKKKKAKAASSKKGDAAEAA